MVSIDAFQALDPGSIPGHRTLLKFFLFVLFARSPASAGTTVMTSLITSMVFMGLLWSTKKAMVKMFTIRPQLFYPIFCMRESLIACLKVGWLQV